MPEELVLHICAVTLSVEAMPATTGERRSACAP